MKMLRIIVVAVALSLSSCVQPTLTPSYVSPPLTPSYVSEFEERCEQLNEAAFTPDQVIENFYGALLELRLQNEAIEKRGVPIWIEIDDTGRQVYVASSSRWPPFSTAFFVGELANGSSELELVTETDFGVMDLQSDPETSNIFVSALVPSSDDASTARMEILSVDLSSPSPFDAADTIWSSPFIIDDVPIVGGWGQSGGRLELQSDGDFLLSVGDFRLAPGTVNDAKLVNFGKYSAENPFLGAILEIDRQSSEAKVLASGTRNVQGLALIEDELLFSDHGPLGGSELNRIGLDSDEMPDFGWPEQTAGALYTGLDDLLDSSASVNEVVAMQDVGSISEWLESWCSEPSGDVVAPVLTLETSFAPSELVELESPFDRTTSNPSEAWIAFGLLKGESLWLMRFDSSQGKFNGVYSFNVGFRVRDIVQLPGGDLLLASDKGSLYLLESNWAVTKLDKY